MTGGRGRWHDRGSAAVEMAVMMPLFVLLFTGVIVIGRTAGAVSAVEMAAFDAARTASLARDHDTAFRQATDSVHASLRRQGHGCVDPPQVQVTGVPDDPYAVPVGSPASVVVRVTCRVSYAGLTIPGLPTDRVVSRYFVSPLDQYRTRP